ncbi:MAG: SH3 domain-containing protein [Lachnospiraceae bacterium]|nr:SH3 domain-containing protein [Lachnospiraceae bacterium]
MDKLKGILRQIKIDKIITFCKENARYFGAGAVFVAIVLVLAFGTNGTASEKDPMAGAYQNYAENDNEEVDKLIKSYLKSYAAGDVDTLKTIATPISDAEVSYIQFYSQYIEKYQKVKVYTKRGVTKDSYLCSVYLQVKFKDIDTPAAGLDFFYVETNEDGKLYINNVYGSFNQANGEFDMDTEVSALIATFEQQPDVLALQADVQKECNEAMLADEKLNSFVNGTLQQAIAKWATDYKASVEQAAQEAAEAKKAEEEAAKKAEEEAKAAEEAKKKEEQENANATKKIATDKINVRDAAAEDGNKLGQLEKGQEVTCYAVENGWAKIDYNGTKAYVKADYLTDPEAEDDATEDQNTSDQSGKQITLSNTVNVRESMSETASKVAVAYAGETLTVVQDYAEGWSKVNYNGKVGYCKTEFLK